MAPATMTFADGLRRAADLIDSSPTLSAETEYADNKVLIYFSGDSRDKIAAVARELPGRVGKAVDENWMNLQIDCGGGVTLQPFASRDAVCERVVVGTEEVKREIEVEITPAETRTETVKEEREIVEWRCGPLLVTAA